MQGLWKTPQNWMPAGDMVPGTRTHSTTCACGTTCAAYLAFSSRLDKAMRSPASITANVGAEFSPWSTALGISEPFLIGTTILLRWRGHTFVPSGLSISCAVMTRNHIKLMLASWIQHGRGSAHEYARRCSVLDLDEDQLFRQSVNNRIKVTRRLADHNHQDLTLLRPELERAKTSSNACSVELPDFINHHDFGHFRLRTSEVEIAWCGTAGRRWRCEMDGSWPIVQDVRDGVALARTRPAGHENRGKLGAIAIVRHILDQKVLQAKVRRGHINYRHRTRLHDGVRVRVGHYCLDVGHRTRLGIFVPTIEGIDRVLLHITA
ncbi:hypothetical protein LMG26857_03599 [Achromobacter anxifer]|nr:hypothetical protein LMG26857_03599 [Achromobacter anxifer]